jgi:hypothetical protein
MIERDETGKAVKVVQGGGVWTESYYDLPVLVGDVLVKFLDDNVAPKLYEEMAIIASKYTQEASEKQLVEIYQGFINDRIALFNSALPIANPTPTIAEPPVVTGESAQDVLPRAEEQK